MKKIIMAKYGFLRWPERDFSDDGNRFTCYRAGKAVRVSKLIADGQAYLSIESSVGKGTLPYEVYQKLPHYQDASWKWNGVSVDSLTDQDLIDFYTTCILYEQEYEEAEATTHFPTTSEIRIRCEELKELRMKELAEVTDLISANIQKLLLSASSYKLAEIQRFYKSLVTASAAYDPNKIRKADSIRFCSDRCSSLQPSWWYKQIVELLAD